MDAQTSSAGEYPADHNEAANPGGVASSQLRAIVQRIERVDEEKAAIMADRKEILAEAKGAGFDTKVLNQVLRIRKQDKAERQEQEAILELYLHALGMVD